MLKKEKNKIALIKYINSIDDINDGCKSKLIEWVEYAYTKRPLTKRDIDAVLVRGFEKDCDNNKLIIAVVDKALQKGIYTPLFLDWKVSYGS